MAAVEEKKAPEHWYAHFLVKGEITIDCYLMVDELMPHLKDAKADIENIDWEGGCCGQTRCACCIGMINSVELISLWRGNFPFASQGKLEKEIFEKLKSEIIDEDDGAELSVTIIDNEDDLPILL